jgi:hypothetical protein
MIDEDNVESEHMDAILDQPEVEQDVSEQPVEREEQKVPLAALQKMRKRAQEAELKAQWLQEQQQQKVAQAPAEEDQSQYESATRADLVRSQEEAVRIVEEKLWIRNNPEKYEKINEYLPTFLKQRPNLASAINEATNRYEEAYTLMEALTPRQQATLKATQTKREAPNAPNGVPKSSTLNAAVDLMNMSDKEFGAWRQSQRRR